MRFTVKEIKEKVLIRLNTVGFISTVGLLFVQESQEERKQCLRHVLPARHPGVQGGFRYHGRRQGETSSVKG